jgi:hypothetical protein
MRLIEYIAWLGAAVSLYGTARYIIGIYRDGTQPRLASWVAWCIANAAMMATAFIHGAHMAAIFDGLSAAGNAGVLIAAASKHAGHKPSGTTDWTCLGVAGVCSLVNAVFPGLALMGTVTAMFANLVATWPTMTHAWHEPFAETWQLFAANAGASLLGVVGVSAGGGFRLTTIAGPLVAMIGNMALTTIALARRIGRDIVSEAVQIEEDVLEKVADFEAEVSVLRERLGAELGDAIKGAAAAPAVPAQRSNQKKVVMIGSEAGG